MLEQRCAGAKKTFGGTLVNLYVDGTNMPDVQASIEAKLQTDKSVDAVVTLGAPFADTAVKAKETAGSEAEIDTLYAHYAGYLQSGSDRTQQMGDQSEVGHDDSGRHGDVRGAGHDTSGPDTDDAMRLVQVRDLLAGQGWFDMVQHRLMPPEGASMHWSRLVDAPLAALIGQFHGAFWEDLQSLNGPGMDVPGPFRVHRPSEVAALVGLPYAALGLGVLAAVGTRFFSRRAAYVLAVLAGLGLIYRLTTPQQQ